VTRYERQFRRIARRLNGVELMRGSIDELPVTDRDLLDRNASRRFLDFYGDEGLRLAFERYGLFGALRQRGWDDFAIVMRAEDDRHTLLVSGRAAETEARLVELVVRRDRLHIEDHARTWDVLTVDWLTLRDPKGSFTKDRMRLPGQDAPGLGIGERVLALLYRVVDRLGLEGLVTVPEHYHNAVLYARELPFVQPRYEGQLRALKTLLLDQEKLSFAQAAWAVHWGHVLAADDSALRWRGEAMVRSHEPQLTEYLGGAEYARTAARAAHDLVYRLHRSAFDEDWQKHEASLLEPPSDGTA
jgi:hypothetical protein